MGLIVLQNLECMCCLQLSTHQFQRSELEAAKSASCTDSNDARHALECSNRRAAAVTEY